ALAKQPEQRYPSVEALALDLGRHIEGQPVQARAQSLGYRLRKYLRRHALGLSIVAIGGSLMAAALAVFVWQAERALAQAARAQAMQDFVIALFEQADGAGSAQTIDVRALLDAGVRRADSELLGQPQSRAELLGLIARLRIGLGDDRAALELLQRQEALLAALPESIALRIGLDAAALRGRALHALGDYPACVDALGPWLARSNALARSHPLPVAELLSQLGRCHHRLGGLDVARDLFGNALQLRRAHAAGYAEAESQADLALLQADAEQPEAALQAMQQALSLLRRHGGDRNALGVRVWQGLGALQRQLGDAQEGEASYRQALEIALGRFGVAHPTTAAVQQALGNLLLARGKFGEAERLLQLARDQLARQTGANDSLWPLWRDLGAAQRELGRSSVAIASYGQAVRLARRQADAETLSQLLCRLAAAHVDVGELDRAEIHAGECRRLADGAHSPAALHALRLQAHIELQRGNADAAAAWLGASEPLLRRFPGESEARALALLRARIALAQDDRSAVTRQLALLLPEAAQAPDDDWHWQALAVQSALRCRSGDSSAGREQRRELLAGLVQRQPERQRLLGELEALSVACAVR
ncbi:MAG TPA: tetratricopeptide repeat protein, partial [Arenimonas sp.]|nr:tetratricopeptide repeat protein [Arenimonas sp.]